MSKMIFLEIFLYDQHLLRIKENLSKKHFAYNSAPFHPTDMVLYSKFTFRHFLWAHTNKFSTFNLKKIAITVPEGGVWAKMANFWILRRLAVGQKVDESA